MRKSELYKYPKNILIPLVLFIIGIFMTFIVYKYNTTKTYVPPKLQPGIKLPIIATSKFTLDVTVTIDTTTKKPYNMMFIGYSDADIDITNDSLILKSIKLVPRENNYSINDYKLENIDFSLTPEYPSSGKINLSTRKLDLSLATTVNYTIKKGNQVSLKDKADLSIPLTGRIVKNAGYIKLSGEATLPPGRFPLPLPFKIGIIASTPQNEASNSQ